MSGFKLDTVVSRGQVTEKVIEELINDAINNLTSSAKVNQIRTKYSNSTAPPISYYLCCYLGNDIRKHRIPMSNYKSNEFTWCTNYYIFLTLYLSSLIARAYGYKYQN